MITVFILILISQVVMAPGLRCFFLISPEPINPHLRLWRAICLVESSGNPLAYHMEKNGFASIGIAQIQASRVKNFNDETGLNYTHQDMYNPDKAKRVFMHYASKYNPHEIEAISREWNAGPNWKKVKSTEKYYQKVKKYL